MASYKLDAIVSPTGSPAWKTAVGVTFYAKAWNEPILLEIAYSYEQHTKHRKSPKYKISD